MFDVIAQAVGFVGMALYIISYQCKSGRKLLCVQLFGAVIYALHFFMLTAYSGALMQIVTAVNCAMLSFGADDPKKLCAWRGWKWIFAACYLASSIFTWKGFFDLLPCIGSLATLFASWTRNGKNFRIAKLFISGPAWMIYDIIEHSYSGIITQLIGMLSVVISIWRYGWKALDQKN